MRLIADTGGVVAAMNTREPLHDVCRRTLEGAQAAYLTDLVATEVHHLLESAGETRAAHDFLLDIVSGFYELVRPEPGDYEVAADLIKRYQGQIRRRRPKRGSLDLADAVNIVMAARLDTDTILTLDQDYRQVAPLAGATHFRLVPFDVE